jgi:hypothetical protein
MNKIKQLLLCVVLITAILSYGLAQNAGSHEAEFKTFYAAF